MTAATIIFFASLVLIIGLFALKLYEERRGERVMEPIRDSADDAAREIKRAVVHSRVQLEKLPPEVAHVTLRGTVSLALSAAALARTFEAQAHRFADFVASKRNFQRRETKSEFLKQVTDYKNGTGEEESQ